MPAAAWARPRSRAGRLYSGPLPLSGELGHTPVLGNNRLCGCGATGCIETLISRKGLIASAQEHLQEPVSWPRLLNLLAESSSILRG